MKTTTLSLLSALTALFFVTGSTVPALLAQETKSPDAKGLLDQLQKVIASQEQKIAGLEKSLKDREKEISDLKKKVEDLSAAKPKEPAKPAGSAFLGIAHEDPDAALRSKLNLKEGQGARVTAVHAQTPAAKAGINEGDVIVSIGGEDVGSAKLRDAIQKRSPGDKLDVVLVRGAEKITRNVELVDREKFLAGVSSAPAPKPAETPKEPAKPAAPEPVFLGLTVEEMDAGLTVQNVEAGKTGAAAQLKEGDVILAINGRKVKKLEELTEARDKTKAGEEMVIEIKRKDEVLRSTVLAAGEKGTPKFVRIEKSAPSTKSPASLGITALDAGDGLKVLEVKDGSGAQQAGIKADDMILELDGTAVKTIDDLRAVLQKHSAGDAVGITIKRGGDTKKIEKLVLGGVAAKLAETASAAPPKDAPKKEEPKKEEPKKEEPKPAVKAKGVLGILVYEDDKDKGVLVVSGVNAKGPAEKAGLKKVDRILKLNGAEIRGFEALEKAMKGLFAGDTIKLTVKRGDEMKELEFQLASPEGSGALETPTPPVGSAERAPVYLGVALGDNGPTGDGSGTGGSSSAGASKVVIEDVYEGSPAAGAGLRTGDHVLAFDDEPVRSIDDVARVLARRAAGETLNLQILRDGRPVAAGVILGSSTTR